MSVQVHRATVRAQRPLRWKLDAEVHERLALYLANVK